MSLHLCQLELGLQFNRINTPSLLRRTRVIMRLRFLRHSLLSDKQYKSNGRGFVEGVYGTGYEKNGRIKVLTMTSS